MFWLMNKELAYIILLLQTACQTLVALIRLEKLVLVVKSINSSPVGQFISFSRYGIYVRNTNQIEKAPMEYILNQTELE